MKHWRLLAGALLAVVYISLAFIGASSGLEAPIDLDRKMLPPFGDDLLGTDENGASLSIQLIEACYLSVTLSVLVAFLSGVVGIFVGSISGLVGGRTDDVFMRAIEILQAFPNILLALCLLAALGPSFYNLLLAMTATTWIGFARLVRAETLHLKSLSFVEASRAFGSSARRLIAHHILPQQTGVLLVHTSHTIAGVVIAEAGLSFLGLGLPADVPSWGQLINRGSPYLEEAPHIVLAPAMMLAGFILCSYLVGDGIQKRLNNRSRI